MTGKQFISILGGLLLASILIVGWQCDNIVWKLEGGRTLDDREVRQNLQKVLLQSQHPGEPIAFSKPFDVIRGQHNGGDGFDEWYWIHTDSQNVPAIKSDFLSSIPPDDHSLSRKLIHAEGPTKCIPPCDRLPSWFPNLIVSDIDAYRIETRDARSESFIEVVWLVFNSRTGDILVNRWSD